MARRSAVFALVYEKSVVNVIALSTATHAPLMPLILGNPEASCRLHSTKQRTNSFHLFVLVLALSSLGLRSPKKDKDCPFDEVSYRLKTRPVAFPLTMNITYHEVDAYPRSRSCLRSHHSTAHHIALNLCSGFACLMPNIPHTPKRHSSLPNFLLSLTALDVELVCLV